MPDKFSAIFAICRPCGPAELAELLIRLCEEDDLKRSERLRFEREEEAAAAEAERRNIVQRR